MTEQYFDTSTLIPGDMIVSSLDRSHYAIVESVDENSYFVRWNHFPNKLEKYRFSEVTKLDSDRVIRGKLNQLAYLIKNDYS